MFATALKQMCPDFTQIRQESDNWCSYSRT